MKRMFRSYNIIMFYTQVVHRKFVLALIFLLSLFSHLNYAQSFDWFKIFPLAINNEDTWQYLPDGLTAEMMIQLSDSPYITSEFPITILPKNGEFYALFSCRFEVLKWTGKEWINLYKGSNSGFNCKAHFFLRNGKIYSHGRYGFWSSHSELLEFDLKNGVWENIHVQNIPNFYEGGYIFVSQNKIFSLKGRYIQQSKDTYDYEENGHIYDFENQEWLKIYLKLDNSELEIKRSDYSYDLKDYGLGIFFRNSEWGALIMDKDQLSFHFVKMDKSLLEKYKYSYGKDNEFFVVNWKNQFFQFDFAQILLNEAILIGEIDNYTKRFGLNKNNVFFLTVVLSIIFIIIFYSHKLKLNRLFIKSDLAIPDVEIQDDDFEEVQQAIDILEQHKNEVFDVQSLDEILRLNKILNTDYRRVKRSRLIKAVNDYYFEQKGNFLIERVKSDEDRRVVYFKIIE